MCYFTLSKFAGCGHSEVEHKPCHLRGSRFPRVTPCIPREIILKLYGQCPDCRESFLQDAETFAQVAKFQAADTPTLFAWPETAKREDRQTSTRSQRPPLRDISLNRIPENVIAAKENRRWSSTVGKPLPNLPAPSDTPRAHHTAASSSDLTRVSPLHGGSRPIAQSRSRPQADRIGHRLKTRDRTERLRDGFQQMETAKVPVTAPSTERKPLPVTAAVRIQEDVERIKAASEAWNKAQDAWIRHRHRPVIHAESKELFLPKRPAKQEDAEHKRDAMEAWEKTQTVWTHHRPLVHTESKELFLTTPVRLQTAEAGMGMTPACLQAGNISQMKSLTRLSTIFNLNIISGGEERAVVTNPKSSPTIATHRISKMKSISEISAHFDMTCGSIKVEPIEFEIAASSRDSHSFNKAQSTSEISATHMDTKPCEAPIELEAHSCRTTPRTPPQTEMSGRMSARVSTVGLWNAYTPVEAAEMETVPELSEAKELEVAHELPDVKRLSAMSFDGTVLEGIFTDR